MKRKLLAIGRRIRRIRKHKKITLPALARSAGISKGNMSKIENYGANMTLATLFAIGDALEMDYSVLIFG